MTIVWSTASDGPINWPPHSDAARAWSTIVIGGLTMPGTCRVNGTGSRWDLQIKKTPGMNGATLGRAQNDDRLALARYGEDLGLAFQLSDDLLDAEKDSAAGKKTFVTLFGLGAARAKLELGTQEAVQSLDRFGARAASLREAAEFMLRRTK